MSVAVMRARVRVVWRVLRGQPVIFNTNAVEIHSGATTWVKPEGATSVTMVAHGRGGGGGGLVGAGSGGGAGGSSPQRPIAPSLADQLLDLADDAALLDRVAAASIGTEGMRAVDPKDVAAILAALSAEVERRDPEPCQHEWLSRHSLDDEWRQCRLCGAWTGVQQ